MERTQELFEKIDAYLNGKLEGYHLKSFQEALKVDEALRSEVEKYRLVQTALKDKEGIAFRKKLQNIDSELKNESANKKLTFNIPRINWKSAAVFVILISLISLVYFQNLSSGKNDLFASYYVPYPMEDLTRGEEISSHASFNKLALNYKNEDYEKVIKILENKAETAASDQLKLYLGNSYLNVNKEDKAIKVFQSIDEESAFYDDARWFLALTYVKMNKVNKAIPVLKELNAYNNLYTGKASELIKALKRNK
ncbi:hypothetical protein [Seonamhaeicola sp.]|uniref:tetratricopeptide repeat protein n=1 Tax=Seonamhaeicola sp. TaxID=1912245 RepID=UPI002602CB3E|nr:hypothetical protein [Seonamhaeicola sp.]